MNFIIPILLQLSAFILGIIEIVLPSMGVLTIIAVSLLGYSWYVIIESLPQAAVWGFAIADFMLLPVFIKIAVIALKKSPLTLQKELKLGTGLSKKLQPGDELLGLTGIVEADLKPTGKALINGNLLEVISESGFIKKDTPVKVIEVSGNKILVEKVSK